MRRAVKAAANGRPRLSVFRSSKHIYAQVIDDVKGVTHRLGLVDGEDPARAKTGANIDAAKAVGKLVAERAQGKGRQGGGVRSRPLYLSTAASRRWPTPRVKAD